MAITLKTGADGGLEQIQTSDSIQADSFERLSGSGDLIVGSTLSGGEDLKLGSTTALVQTLGDAQIDGELLVETVVFLEVAASSASGALTVPFDTDQKVFTSSSENITSVVFGVPSNSGNFVWEFRQTASHTLPSAKGSYTIVGGVVKWVGNAVIQPDTGSGKPTLYNCYFNGTDIIIGVASNIG